MRLSLTFIFIVLSAALVAAGCGGPKNAKEELKAACERQIEETKGGDTGTPSGKTSKAADEAEQLVHCAGQPAIVAAADTSDKDAGDKSETGDDKAGDKGGDAELSDDDLTKARSLFNDGSCASCHALADADASGAMLDLDESTMNVADMHAQIENGGGSMPPGLLTGDDAQLVAEYIAQVRAG